MQRRPKPSVEILKKSAKRKPARKVLTGHAATPSKSYAFRKRKFPCRIGDHVTSSPQLPYLSRLRQRLKLKVPRNLSKEKENGSGCDVHKSSNKLRSATHSSPLSAVNSSSELDSVAGISSSNRRKPPLHKFSSVISKQCYIKVEKLSEGDLLKSLHQGDTSPTHSTPLKRPRTRSGGQQQHLSPAISQPPAHRHDRQHSVSFLVESSPSWNRSADTWRSQSSRPRTASKEQEAKLKRLSTRRVILDPELMDMSESSQLSLQSSIAADPLKKLMELCGQSEVKTFQSFFDDSFLEGLKKVGEGVYGEVFRTARGPVIKIFPIDGQELVNGEKQMTCSEVYPEVFVSKKLTELAYKHRVDRAINFVQVKRATVVQGELPPIFAEVWRNYAEERGTDNECLDFLTDSQLWMVLEYDFAGEPLSRFRFTNYREARSVIEQLALSLAAAESALEFEHRDLHWLNVLVRRQSRQAKLRYRIGGAAYAVLTQGVQVTIIDFTVSRLCDGGNTVYVDMSDSPEIFEGEGDYQFEIYRMMRDYNKNEWRTFHPVTNLFWLHYLMNKLINETSYPRRDPDCMAVESELRALYDSVLAAGYTSATDLVKNNFYFDACRIDE